MRRGTELLILLAIGLWVLGGMLASPVWTPALIGLGSGCARWGWVLADRDELIRMFG